MIGEALDLDRPARCERSGAFLADVVKRGAPCCPPEGCDVLLQNGYRYGWSESNVRYEGPRAGRDADPRRGPGPVSALPRASVPVRALVVREPVMFITHPVILTDGTPTECRTQRPAGTCTCGTWALDWIPLPGKGGGQP